MSKKKVVVIGGGNGSAISIVALKQNLDLFDISAVISMSDSGDSSGRLREEFNTLPPGDIMRAVLALSKYDYPLLKQIFFRNRFSGAGKLDGHNLGNLALILGEKYDGDFMSAIRALEQNLPRLVDHAVYNNVVLSAEHQALYKQKHWVPLVDDVENQKEMNIIKADYERAGGGLCSVKLGKILQNILV